MCPPSLYCLHVSGSRPGRCAVRVQLLLWRRGQVSGLRCQQVRGRVRSCLPVQHDGRPRHHRPAGLPDWQGRGECDNSVRYEETPCNWSLDISSCAELHNNQTPPVVTPPPPPTAAPVNGTNVTTTTLAPTTTTTTTTTSAQYTTTTPIPHSPTNVYSSVTQFMPVPPNFKRLVFNEVKDRIPLWLPS